MVDDGSTDGTDEVLATYVEKDSRFQCHHRPKNRQKGANACRNYGFELSTGEYVNWFDSDDLMFPDKIRIQLSVLINSNFDFSVCQTLVYDRNQDKILGLRKENIQSNNSFEDYILFNIFWTTIAPLWKKSFLNQNNLLFDESLQQAQEYDFHTRVLSISTNYISLNEPLNYLVDHDHNLSKSFKKSKDKIWSNLKVQTKILKLFHSDLEKRTLKVLYNRVLNIYCENQNQFGLNFSFGVFKQAIFCLKYLDLDLFHLIKYRALITGSFFSFLVFKKGFIFTYSIRRDLKSDLVLPH